MLVWRSDIMTLVFSMGYMVKKFILLLIVLLVIFIIHTPRHLLALTCADLDGAYVYSQETSPVYLGFFGNSYASDSIMNSYGTYGSPYTTYSVRNTYGTYGSPYSVYSANNNYTSTPPKIYNNGYLIGYLTTNNFIWDGVSLAVIDANCIFYSSAPGSYPRFNVTVSSTTGGSTDKDGENIVNYNGSLIITATPDTGYHFTGWSGDASGTTNPLTISNITSAMTIQANFAINTFNVTENPTANAGPDQQIVTEGTTVTLNGSNSSDPDDGIASYLWTQTLGPPVTFSNPTSINPTFLTPPVNNGQETLTFRLTVTDQGGLQSTDDITVTVTDNGITGFPADVVTMETSTGENYGMKVDNGGAVTGLQALDPSTIADTSNRPDELPYGLIDLQAKTDIPGGTMKVTIYLPSPAPPGYKWFKYSPSKGWYDFSSNATFNAARTQVTLTLTDGGTGDDDGTANGVIVDPSGLGFIPDPTPTPTPTPPTSDSGGGGGGCFISTIIKN